MGRLIIQFFSNGINVGTPPYVEDKLAAMQYFQMKYNTTKMGEIEFAGEDFNIDLDINLLERTINWEEQNFPNEVVKEKVIEIAYYKDVLDKVKKIIEEINSYKFEDKYNIRSCGNKAVEIVKQTRPSKYFDGLKHINKNSMNSIAHTLGKEVEALEETKDSAVKHRKQNVLQDAKNYLVSDINEIVHQLEHYKVNSN